MAQDPWAAFRKQPAAQPDIQPQPFPGAVPVMPNPAKQQERQNAQTRLDIDVQGNARAADSNAMEHDRLDMERPIKAAKVKALEANGGVDTTEAGDKAAGLAFQMKRTWQRIQDIEKAFPDAVKPSLREVTADALTENNFLRNAAIDPAVREKRMALNDLYRSFTQNAIYQASGAAFQQQELDAMIQNIKPNYFDTPFTREQKKGQIEDMIAAGMLKAGASTVKVGEALAAFDKIYSPAMGIGKGAEAVPTPDGGPEIKPSDRNVQVVQIPEPMQQEYDAWLKQHPPGSMNVEDYLAFRRELDKKYNFGDQAYEGATDWVKAYNAGKAGTKLPPAEKQLTGLSASVAEASRDPGLLGDVTAGVKNFANAASMGIPTLMADEFSRQASKGADAAHPKSALTGELLGSLAPVMGLEGAAMRAGMGRVGADIAANTVYGGVRGFNEADNGHGLGDALIEGALGGAGSIVGRGLIKGARGFMGEKTVQKLNQFTEPKTFEIPGREPLIADAVTPARFQSMSEAELKAELAKTKQGLQTWESFDSQTARDSAQTTAAKAARDQKLLPLLAKNRQEQERFAAARGVSKMSPEAQHQFYQSMEEEFPTTVEGFLRKNPDASMEIPPAQAAPKLESPRILQERAKRLEQYLATPDNPGVGTIPGADPTTMQRIGATNLEESANRLPFVHNAREGAIASWNVQNSGRVLARIGEEVPKDVPAGQDMNAFVNGRLNAFYQKLGPRITGKIDRGFNNGYGALMTKAASRRNITQEELAAIQAMKDARAKFIKSDGSYNAEGYKQFTTDLRSLAEELNNAEGVGSARLRELARDVELLRKQGQALISRNDPFVGKQLKKVEGAWAHQARIDLASRGAAKATRGIYSPDQLLSAIERADTSKNKAAVSRGKAFDQQYAQDAREVFGGTPPKMASSHDAALVGYAVGNSGWFGKSVAALTAAGYTPGLKRAIQAFNAGKVGEAADKLVGLLPKSAQAKAKGLPSEVLQEMVAQAIRDYAAKHLTSKGN